MAEAPDDVAYRIDLAQTLNDEALRQHIRRDQSGANSTIERMTSLVKSLSPEEPRLGNISSLVAQQLFNENRIREAVPWLDRHIRETERLLSQTQPGTVREFTRGLLQSMHIAMAELLYALGELPRSLAAWDKAIEIGDVPKAALGRSYCQRYRTWVLLRLGKYSEALDQFKQSVAEATMQRNPSKTGI